MATLYRCDRCSKEDDEPLCHVLVPRIQQSYAKRDTSDQYAKDLCDNCVRQLNEWIKPLAKEENARTK